MRHDRKSVTPLKPLARLKTHASFLLIAIIVLFLSAKPALSQEHGTLTTDQLHKLGSTAELDINLIRLHPELLENKALMAYFISLNNCHDPNIRHTVDNELDYPKLAAYYRSKAAEITGSLPPVIGIAIIGGVHKSGDYRTEDTMHLGEYDTTKGAFPLIFKAAWGTQPSAQNVPNNNTNGSSGSGTTTITLGSLFHKKHQDEQAAQPAAANEHHVVQIAESYNTEAIRQYMYTTCPSVYQGQSYGTLPYSYTINISPNPMGFDALPMSEDAARAYINNHPPALRGVEVDIYVRILDQPSDLQQDPNHGPGNIKHATLTGKIVKVSVRDVQTKVLIGNLYDDHSFPDE